jgi:hypothetical protein
MNIFRKVKEFFVKNNQVKVRLPSYNSTTDFEKFLYFPDGLISKSSNTFAKFTIKGEEFATLINNPTDAVVLFEKLANGDIITGRDGVYIHYSTELKQINILANKISFNINGNILNIDENGISATANKLDIDISGKKLTIDSKLKFDNKEVAVVGGLVNLSNGQITNSGQ